MSEGRAVMAEVYVVTAGEYSDYHLVGVFSTAEAAAATAAITSDGHVEEYPVDEVAYRPTWRCRATVAIARNEWGTEPVDPRWPTVGGFPEHGQWVYVPLPGPEVTVAEPDQYGDNGEYDDPTPATRDDVELQWQWPRAGEPPYEAWVRTRSTTAEGARKAAAERAYRIAAEWDVEVEAARDRGDWR